MKFALTGSPLSHSMSPALFKAAYHGRFGYDLLETGTFAGAWDAFIAGYDAVNVTMPFKEEAAAAADILSPEVALVGAANILVKTPDGVKAFNSDYFAVREILARAAGDNVPAGVSVAVIGFGGAGKAALSAAGEMGFQTRLFRHDGIGDGVEADIVVYTLPKPVPGVDRIRCSCLVEANYKDPCLAGIKGAVYVPGISWLVGQAVAGFPLMTGLEPDVQAVRDLAASQGMSRLGSL